MSCLDRIVAPCGGAPRFAVCLIAPVALALAGCGASREASAPAPPPVASAPAPGGWQSPLGREHPLVGQIVDAASGAQLSERALYDALSAAPVVVLGEQHDNPDHHRLQARAIEALVARGQRPAVVFEMVELAQQPALEHALAGTERDPDVLARALDWGRSGWPPFALYRPIFEVALRHRLPLWAGSLDREQVMRVAREGVAALDPELTQRHALAEPPRDASMQALRAEMQRAHCSMLPEAMLDPMVLVQRARDAMLARRAQQAAQAQGSAVLITGNGHARRDRGVPRELERAYGRQSRALALIEVRAGLQRPADYARELDAKRLPYDYVWFTPRISDEDHCAALRERFGK